MPPIPPLIFHNPTLWEELQNNWGICLVYAILVVSFAVYPGESTYVCRTILACFIAVIEGGSSFSCYVIPVKDVECTPCRSCRFKEIKK